MVRKLKNGPATSAGSSSAGGGGCDGDDSSTSVVAVAAATDHSVCCSPSIVSSVSGHSSLGASLSSSSSHQKQQQYSVVRSSVPAQAAADSKTKGRSALGSRSNMSSSSTTTSTTTATLRRTVAQQSSSSSSSNLPDLLQQRKPISSTASYNNNAYSSSKSSSSTNNTSNNNNRRDWFSFLDYRIFSKRTFLASWGGRRNNHAARQQHPQQQQQQHPNIVLLIVVVFVVLWFSWTVMALLTVAISPSSSLSQPSSSSSSDIIYPLVLSSSGSSSSSSSRGGTGVIVGGGGGGGDGVSSPQRTTITTPLIRGGSSSMKTNMLSNTIPLPLPKEKVTVILMNYSRPRMIRESSMMRTLLAHPNIDEVLLLHSNPSTAFELVHPKVKNVDAIEHNKEMGLSLRFYFCQMASNQWVLHLDDDMEFTTEALNEMLIEYSRNPKRIVGRFGRNLMRGPNSFNGYNSKNTHKSTEVVLTKLMVMERDVCTAFFEYSHLVWSEIVHNGEGPLWNGEDIFMSLVANHVYAKPKGKANDGSTYVNGGGGEMGKSWGSSSSSTTTTTTSSTTSSSSSSTTTTTIDGTTEPFNNYAMDWLDVWQADDSLKDYDNGKYDISGGMEGIRFWNWRWWQTLLRRNRHYSYRGKLWKLARARLKELSASGNNRGPTRILTSSLSTSKRTSSSRDAVRSSNRR